VANWACLKYKFFSGIVSSWAQGIVPYFSVIVSRLQPVLWLYVETSGTPADSLYCNLQRTCYISHLLVKRSLYHSRMKFLEVSYVVLFLVSINVELL
jgi:hypothetical protein